MDSLKDYRTFVRISFRFTSTAPQSRASSRQNSIIKRKSLSRTSSQYSSCTDEVQEEATASHRKDLYFGNLNDVWLSELCMAKKRINDVINTMATSSTPLQTLSEKQIPSPVKTSIGKLRLEENLQR